MITQNQIKRIDHIFPVLTLLGERERQILHHAGQVIELPAGQMLMQQNQQCQFIPLVLGGLLRVFKLSPGGREMTLYRTGPGDTCLASIACQLKGEDFPALAQVEEPVSLFMVPITVYHEVLDKQMAWKDYLVEALYDHLTETMETLEAVAFDRTDRRLASWLLEQTNRQKGQIQTTHEAIAIELGTAREVVSRLLGELKSHGAVSLGRGKIEILAPAILQGMLDN